MSASSKTTRSCFCLATNLNFRQRRQFKRKSDASKEKKNGIPIGIPFSLEAPPRFELGNEAFAELCLTAWPWRRSNVLNYYNKVDLVCQGGFAFLCLICFLFNYMRKEPKNSHLRNILLAIFGKIFIVRVQNC